ncbi:MAG: hypothetical protein ACTSO9_00980 [Candidatus Helarchaeota archaeon]
MKNRALDSIVIWVVVTGFFWGLGLLIAWGDYALNKSLIDAVRFTQFEWWHWITWRHWWAWLFAYDLGAYLLYSFIVCSIISAIITFIWFGREWD